MELKTAITNIQDGREHTVAVELDLSGEELGDYEKAYIKVRIGNSDIMFRSVLEYDMPVFLADEESVKTAKSLPLEIYDAARIAAQTALYVVSKSRQSESCMLPRYYVIDGKNKLSLMLVKTGTGDTDEVAVLYALRSDGMNVTSEYALLLYDYDDVRDACTGSYGVVPEEIAQYERIKGTKYAYDKDCPDCFKDFIKRDPGALTAICTTRLKELNGFDIEAEFNTVLDYELRHLGFSVFEQ